MLGADDARRLGRELSLVDHVAVAGEADREGGGWGLGAQLHGRHHARAVHAAGEEGAVGDVGHHLALDRVGEALGELVRELVVGRAQRWLPGASRQLVTRGLPFSSDTSSDAGGSFLTPSKSVRGEGTKRQAR